MGKKVVRVSGFDYLFFSFPFSFALWGGSSHRGGRSRETSDSLDRKPFFCKYIPFSVSGYWSRNRPLSKVKSLVLYLLKVAYGHTHISVSQYLFIQP